jgi:hypothetical protein
MDANMTAYADRQQTQIGKYTVKKACRNAPNSDAENGDAEPNDVGVGIFLPPRRLVRTTVVHIGISRSFFYSVGCRYSQADQLQAHAVR